MNLYRSFGCLLEAYVAEGYPDKSSSTGNNSEKCLEMNGSHSASANSLRLMGSAFRSESEDSGMESPSMVSPLPLHHRGLSPESQTALDDFCPTSSSPSCSVRSSSSSCLSKGSLKPAETAAFMVEEALQRTEPSWRRSVDGSLRRRCNTTSVTSGLHASLMRRRAGGLQPGRTEDGDPGSESLIQTHIPEQSGSKNTDPAEISNDCEHLSPGLLYLEQLCRMLEEISRLQKHNQNLQLQIQNIHEQKEETQTEDLSTQNVTNGSTTSEMPDVGGSEDQARFPDDDFRRRSVSDTSTFLRNPSKSKILRAEQFTSTDVLLEEPDDPPAIVKPEQKKTSSSLKLRIISLGKTEKTKSLKNSSSSVEKKMSFRQMFRRRTTPLEHERTKQNHVQ